MTRAVITRTVIAMPAVGIALSAWPISSALAWGHTGHVSISQLAILALPEEVPAFLRTDLAAKRLGELGAEADESKTTGEVQSGPDTGRIQTAPAVHDAERDPGHYIDIGDDRVVLGGKVNLFALPATREAFDTAQRSATSPGAQTQYSAGYLPYTIIDGFQQVRKDFGIWRALKKGIQTAASPQDRDYFKFALQLREQLTIRDIGYWSHFVADASQPMHVSVHFNGWGNFPNPNGYTTSPIHAPFEGTFVRSFIDFNDVSSAVRPYSDCHCPIEARVPRYLDATLGALIPVYEAAKVNGNDNYQTAQPAEVAIVTQQLAAGVSELRDEIIDAWRQSTDITVGFPLVRVSAVEAGSVTITPATFGAD